MKHVLSTEKYSKKTSTKAGLVIQELSLETTFQEGYFSPHPSFVF